MAATESSATAANNVVRIFIARILLFDHSPWIVSRDPHHPTEWIGQWASPNTQARPGLKQYDNELHRLSSIETRKYPKSFPDVPIVYWACRCRWIARAASGSLLLSR